MTTTDEQVPLSVAARTVWAKSYTDAPTRATPVAWYPLNQHLDDTAGIAAKLWEYWIPENIKQNIARSFNDDEQQAKILFTWLAGTHDIGKISPAFAVQQATLADAMHLAGFAIPQNLAGTEERRRVRHETVSHMALIEWLQNRHEFSWSEAEQYAAILGAHHGRAPTQLKINEALDCRHLSGKGLWEDVRNEYLDRAATILLPGADLELWRNTTLSLTTQVLFSALVIVADWLASNEQYFPGIPLESQASTATANQRVEDAWAALNFPEPWHLPEPQEDIADLFACRFALPKGSQPRGLQATTAQLARSCRQPELMIVEAQMGLGKTEAALLSTEIFAARFALGGVAFLLPTQATTNGMFPRLYQWLETFDGAPPSTVHLAHGKAALNDRYRRLLSEAYFRSIGEDNEQLVKDQHRHRSENVIAHRWMVGNKQGPLANVMVGTVDQALFLALKSRHLMLRHLAFAGKAVIIDEVHAYDAYMSVFLDRLLHWLGAYGVPVLLLSATLPGSRRQKMLLSYDEGRLAGAGKNLTDETKEQYTSVAGDIGYPAVTHTHSGGLPQVVNLEPDPGQHHKHLRLHRISDTSEAIEATLREALRDGGCAAVIHNTVDRVQNSAKHLRAALPDTEVIVAHSRFLAADRAANDAALLDKFGSPQRATGRPQKAVVVASQVIEQSLDLDFDVMVTDLAPIDLLFQRSGRLHRHDRGPDEHERPQPLRQPTLFITGTDWDMVPPKPNRAYRRVYHRHILYRTLAALEGKKFLVLPSDIPTLVQQVYAEYPIGPPSWQETMTVQARASQDQQADKKRRAEVFLLPTITTDEQSLLDWADRDADDASDDLAGRAAVRDSAQSLEVIAIQRRSDGHLQLPDWLDEHAGFALPLDEPPAPWLGRLVLGCALTLPAWACQGDQLDAHIRTLEDEFDLPQWQHSRELKGELVLCFDENNTAYLNDYTLRYDRETGLEVEK